MNEELLSCFTRIPHCEKEITKGTYLFQEGDVSDQIYLIRSGKVKIGKITPDGRELTFRICKPGEIISEIALFRPPAPHYVHALMLEHGSLLVFRKEDVEEQLLLKPNFSAEFIKIMELQRQRTQSKFRDLILHGKKGALYSTLIRLTNSYGIEKADGILIDLVLTNQELANFCGMAREVVNRLLSEMKREGIISMEQGKIVIHDLKFLKDTIHCENCPPEICNIY